jgi:hypothetical protein
MAALPIAPLRWRRVEIDRANARSRCPAAGAESHGGAPLAPGVAAGLLEQFARVGIWKVAFARVVYLPITLWNDVLSPRLARELLAEIRVCNRNEADRSFGDRFALEIDDPVFGHDVHGVSAWRRHDISRG